jgi:hypothetical protein
MILIEEHRMEVFEHRMLTEVFGSKWDKVNRGMEKTA